MQVMKRFDLIMSVLLQRVEELFALNEDAQLLLTVFSALSAGSMSLAAAKSKITKQAKPVKACFYSLEKN